MSSSSEAAGAVLRGDQVGTVSTLPTPELRTGTWTRHGDRAVLGDPVAESVLGELAASARAAAEAQGYAVGWAQGRREAEAEAAATAREVARRAAESEARREAEHRDALAALTRAAADVRDQLAGLAAAVQDQASDLAWTLTQELVGRELAATTGRDLVRRVLDVTPGGMVARVRLHPDLCDEGAAREVRDSGLTLVPDASLARGDALVESDGSVVDLRVTVALERVGDALA
jgi:flagellar assembly protein FliH